MIEQLDMLFRNSGFSAFATAAITVVGGGFIKVILEKQKAKHASEIERAKTIFLEERDSLRNLILFSNDVINYYSPEDHYDIEIFTSLYKEHIHNKLEIDLYFAPEHIRNIIKEIEGTYIVFKIPYIFGEVEHKDARSFIDDKLYNAAVELKDYAMSCLTKMRDTNPLAKHK